VRDLIVHGDDLAVATHGRGFWILDDIAPIRQFARGGVKNGPALLKPQTAVRVRRNRSTDTPLPPDVPAGQNPPDGAIIDYYLDANAAGRVTLEVRTAAGRLVRRYSSDDRPEEVDERELRVPTYWVRPPQVLQATAGLHRFVWDLRYAPPDAFEHDYPISAIYRDTPREPQGVLATPGTYTLTLMVNGRTFTQPLTLSMDPRASITPAGLRQQFTVATKVVDLMHRSHAAKLTALNNDLAAVLEVVDGTDRAPTAQAIQAVADLERRLAAELARPRP